MPFSNLTIVSVTGADEYAEGSMWAIARSCAELPGSKGLLISPNRPANLPESICHQPCKRFGYMEYSIFMIYGLAQYIETDYCLVVQNDGWVLNGQNWRDEFWQYDYIGAPIIEPYCRSRDQWGQLRLHIDEHSQQAVFPQNGGFSLRSKRFLEMPRRLGIAAPIHPPEIIVSDQPYCFDWGTTPTHSEDLFLTVAIRPELEQSGIRFAPFEVANAFAFESGAAPYFCQTSFGAALGHHFFKTTKLVGMNEVQAGWPAAFFSEIERPTTDMLISAFTQRGYNLTVNVV